MVLRVPDPDPSGAGAGGIGVTRCNGLSRVKKLIQCGERYHVSSFMRYLWKSSDGRFVAEDGSWTNTTENARF
jgi:hypothetical protein